MGASQGQGFSVQGQPQPYTTGGKGGAGAVNQVWQPDGRQLGTQPGSIYVPPANSSYTPPTGTGVYGQYNGNVFGNSSQALQAAQRSAHSIASGGGYRGGGPSSYVPATGWDYTAANSSGVTAPQTYASRQLSNTDLSQYTNPYESQVIDRAIDDLNQARLMAVNETGADATRAGAFGGARHALREAQNDSDFYEQVAATTGDLRHRGYLNAQQQALADIGNENDASRFNIGNELQTSSANLQNNQFNATSQNRASEFGRSSALQAAMANQSADVQRRSIAAQSANNQANRQLQAASLLGNLSNLGFGMGQSVRAGNAAQGDAERALSQAIIDAAQGQFGGYTQAPYGSMDMLNAVMTGRPTGSSQEYEPGTMDYVSATATIAGSILSAIYSDARLKENTEQVGEYKGHNVYTWNWTDDAKKLGIELGPEFGVLAHEVAETRPDAVSEGTFGLLMVDYGAL